MHEDASALIAKYSADHFSYRDNDEIVRVFANTMLVLSEQLSRSQRVQLNENVTRAITTIGYLFKIEPSSPRTMLRPSELPIARNTLFAAVSNSSLPVLRAAGEERVVEE